MLISGVLSLSNFPVFLLLPVLIGQLFEESCNSGQEMDRVATLEACPTTSKPLVIVGKDVLKTWKEVESDAMTKFLSLLEGICRVFAGLPFDSVGLVGGPSRGGRLVCYASSKSTCALLAQVTRIQTLNLVDGAWKLGPHRLIQARPHVAFGFCLLSWRVVWRRCFTM